ncbi:MAG: radical SAM protein [Lutisporaceae bacterium]
MKLALIFAPFWETKYPPIGIAALKSYLQDRNHKIDTYDYNVDALPIMYKYQEQIVKEARKIHPPFSEIMKFHFIYFIVEELQNYVLYKCEILDEKKYFEAVCYHFSTDYVFRSKEELENTARKVSALFLPFFEEVIKFCDDRVEEVIAGGYDYIGCSCNNFNFPFSMLFLKKIKEKAPHIKTLMGGFHATLISDVIDKRCYWVDHIVIGEGEELMARLLADPSITDRVISHQSMGVSLLDLNELPYPDFSDFELDVYQSMPIEGSRGCLYKCAFCREAQFWKKYRMKSGKRIREEMQYLANKYNKTHFFFTDSLTNPKAKDLAEELLANNCNYTWVGQFRIMKNPELLNKLAKAGLREVYYGMESASQRVLNVINKENTVEDMRAAVIETAKAGIRPITYWIAGFPTETDEDFEKTIAFIIDLKDYTYIPGVFPFALYKGALVDYMVKELGVKINDRLPELEEFSDMYDFDAYPSRSEVRIRVMHGYSRLMRYGFEYDFLSNQNNIDKYDRMVEEWEEKRKKILAQEESAL